MVTVHPHLRGEVRRIPLLRCWVNRDFKRAEDRSPAPVALILCLSREPTPSRTGAYPSRSWWWGWARCSGDLCRRGSSSLEAVMNLLRNGLLMRKTGDRRRSDMSEKYAFVCGFSAEFITLSRPKAKPPLKSCACVNRIFFPFGDQTGSAIPPWQVLWVMFLRCLPSGSTV